MNNPELYVRVNHVERGAAQQALQEFGSAINWRSDGRDSILDAGCGPGDVTVDILMPILPPNFKRLVGVDISEEMIDYARETYDYPKLSFELFDLDKDLEKQPFRDVKPFDHIFSFNVIMWIANLETCIRNFYKLLVPNGDILLLTPSKAGVYDIYKEQSRDKKWAKYMKGLVLDNEKSPFRASKYLNKDFCGLLSNHGFTDCEVKTLTRNATFKNIDSLREFLHVVSPFIDQIPVNDRAEFVDDLIQKMRKGFYRPNGGADEDKLILPCKNVVLYAKKKGGKNEEKSRIDINLGYRKECHTRNDVKNVEKFWKRCLNFSRL